MLTILISTIFIPNATAAAVEISKHDYHHRFQYCHDMHECLNGAPL